MLLRRKLDKSPNVTLFDRALSDWNSVIYTWSRPWSHVRIGTTACHRCSSFCSYNYVVKYICTSPRNPLISQFAFHSFQRLPPMVPRIWTPLENVLPAFFPHYDITTASIRGATSLEAHHKPYAWMCIFSPHHWTQLPFLRLDLYSGSRLVCEAQLAHILSRRRTRYTKHQAVEEELALHYRSRNFRSLNACSRLFVLIEVGSETASRGRLGIKCTLCRSPCY